MNLTKTVQDYDGSHVYHDQTAANPSYNKEAWLRFRNQVINIVKRGGHLRFSTHYRDEKMMEKYGLSVTKIYQIIRNTKELEIIQGHKKNTYMGAHSTNKNDVYVFYGKSLDGQPWHIVMARQKFYKDIHKKSSGTRTRKPQYDIVWKVVSIYRPSLEFFKDDLKTLRTTRFED